jgi:hypothetical protein
VAPEKPAAAANTSSAGGFSWTKPVAAEEGAKEETSDKNGDEAKKPAESPAVNLAVTVRTALALLALCLCVGGAA